MKEGKFFEILPYADKTSVRKHLILEEMMKYDRVSFADLFRSGIFSKNRRDLANCLKELEKEQVIKKIKPPRKYPYYILSETAHTLRFLKHEDKKLEGLVSVLLEDIKKSKLEYNHAIEMITAFIFKELREYLDAIVSVVLASDNIRPSVGWFADRCTARFQRILVQCGHKYPDETQKAVDNVKHKLNKQKSPPHEPNQKK